MHPYIIDYVFSLVKRQGELFFYVRDVYPDIDTKWFIETWMKSHIRAMIDDGNPKYLNMPTTELLDRFIVDELKGEYKKGNEWGGVSNIWAGQFYQWFHWEKNILSKDLIELVTLDDIYRIYPALHQTSWEYTIDKVADIILKDKGIKV